MIPLVSDWFGGPKADHPMADIWQARKILSELPATDAVKALEQTGFWLDSIAQTDGFKPDYRLQLVDLLDQVARKSQRRITAEYLSGQRPQKLRENMLWGTAFRFWKLLGASYNRCIDDFRSGASGWTSIRNQLPLMIARALRALTLQLKWSLLRYGPIEDRIWAEAARLYSLAETQRIATSAVEVYPGPQQRRSSVRQEFARAMMLAVSSADALKVLEQEIAERVLAILCGRFVVRDQPGRGCTFVFDLSARERPARAVNGLQPAGAARYFGAGDAAMALAGLTAEIRQKESLPAELNPGGQCETGLVLRVLEHLALQWSDFPPSRKSERRTLTLRLTVAPGLEGLLNEMEPESGNSLDFTQTTESWIAENASETGYGAVIPQQRGDWIRVGALIGLQSEASDAWHAGIIRRIGCDGQLQRRVGIHLLSPYAMTVLVTPTSKEPSANGEGEPAVLLSSKPDQNGEIGLLLRAGTFEPGRALEMSLLDNNYLLLPAKLIERGDDFDCAQFALTHGG